MITDTMRNAAHTALRTAGFTHDEVVELLATPAGLRDEFAGRAMAAMLTHHRWVVSELAKDAYNAADAMMARRSEP